MFDFLEPVFREIEPWGPEWVGAIGQVLGAIFTFIAALVAAWAAIITRGVAQNGVAATQHQTSMAAIQEMLRDYASNELYIALRTFGRFVGANRERFKQISCEFARRGRKLDRATAKSYPFNWAVEQVERNLNIGTARRQIHHHFSEYGPFAKRTLYPMMTYFCSLILITVMLCGGMKFTR